MTKDGALRLPADLGQPSDVLALTGSLLGDVLAQTGSLQGESFDDSFASLPGN